MNAINAINPLKIYISYKGCIKTKMGLGITDKEMSNNVDIVSLINGWKGKDI